MAVHFYPIGMSVAEPWDGEPGVRGGGAPAFSEKSPQPECSCRTGERLQPEGAEASGGGTGCIEIKEVGE